MEKNTKYIFIELEERNGEYEYTHKSVHELLDDKKTTTNKFVKNHVKEFYGGKAKPYDGGYYFHGGEVFVSISSWKSISKEQHDVLNQFL